MKNRFTPILFLLVAMTVPLRAADWNVLKTYKFGDDLTPLLAIEKEIRQGSDSPESQAKWAAKLASFLTAETPYPGRQFVCMQLRFVGTAAEIPALAGMLGSEPDTDNVRMVLEKIPGDASLVPLREALKTLKGRARCGIIESLAARKDAASLPALVELMKSEDKDVALAAASALGAFGPQGEQALDRAKGAVPESVRTAALLRIAEDAATRGDKDKAASLFAALTAESVPAVQRRAAYQGQLALRPEAQRKETVFQWVFDKDAEKNLAAAPWMKDLSDVQFDKLVERFPELSVQSKIAFYETFAGRDDQRVVDLIQKALGNADPLERLSALRAAGKTRGGALIPALIDALKQDGNVRAAARDALQSLPSPLVGEALLKTVNDPSIRNQALDLLATIKYRAAIDPLIALARSEDAAVFSPVLVALGNLCDPDDRDIPRLVDLYFSSRPGAHREQVERAIVIVSERDADADRRGDRVLNYLEKQPGGLSPADRTTVLPLLAKLGNKRIAESMVFPLLQSDKPELRRLGVRALCNWPNADYHEELWNIATKDAAPQFRQWALRAYVRVVTLKSDRPEEETLDMLKKAMNAAENDADKKWCLSRAVTVRIMPAVEWAASYLDDPALAQTACSVLSGLGRHRFLREPNKERFNPILEKVARIARDQSVIEGAQRSLLGM